MSTTFSTALSGMSAAVTRMMNAATNIVNASSTGRLPSAENPKATSYMPTDVVSVSNSVRDERFGVQTEIVPREPAYYTMRDESSPFANEKGLIAAPNVDVTSEIIESQMALVAYKASASVIKVEKEAQETLLDTMS